MKTAKEQFKLYKANSADKTYMGSLTAMEDFSFSLVISTEPCDGPADGAPLGINES